MNRLTIIIFVVAQFSVAAAQAQTPFPPETEASDKVWEQGYDACEAMRFPTDDRAARDRSIACSARLDVSRPICVSYRIWAETFFDLPDQSPWAALPTRSLFDIQSDMIEGLGKDPRSAPPYEKLPEYQHQLRRILADAIARPTTRNKMEFSNSVYRNCLRDLPVASATVRPLEEVFTAYGHGDYTTALRLLRPLAGQGIALAEYNLGVLYMEGHGVPQDYAEAVKWYRKAADQGQVNAEYNLGLMYYRGRGVPVDYAEAVKWLRKAADQGWAEARTSLAAMHANDPSADAMVGYGSVTCNREADATYTARSVYKKWRLQGLSQDDANAATERELAGTMAGEKVQGMSGSPDSLTPTEARGFALRNCMMFDSNNRSR